MRAVNLLAQKERPRVASGERQGGAYAVLGVLGGLLVLVVLYVLTVNQISSREDEVKRVENETRAAQANASSLESFGRFAQIKETRLQSIRELADGRFDWERLMRELAHLLPDEVWLTDLEASASGQDGAPGATGAGGSPGASQTAAAGPQLKLTGCARRQPDVAVMLVRLRRLDRAEDVQLGESKREESDAGTGAGAGASSGDSAASDSAGVEGCGKTGKHENYKFDATVSFNATPARAKEDGAGKVPVSLGGGS